MKPYVIIGAGPSGLGAAHALMSKSTSPVIIVDRVPVPGGEAGWNNKFLNQKYQELVESPQVEFRLGQTATRWSKETLTVLGPGLADDISADHLFFAGGIRPSTAADLKISGDRPAGVLPATVADHILKSGEALWRNPLIIGDSHWAPILTHEIHKYGGLVQGLKGSHDWADITHDVEGEIVVSGTDRIESVTVLEDGQPSVIPCDALLLADRPRPNRNVVGALFDLDENVTFLQPVDLEGEQIRFDSAFEITAQWIQTNGESDES